MNAGEAVYRGQEGSGLAQVGRWQEPRPITIPFGVGLQNQFRLEQMRRAQRAQDYKQSQEFLKFDKGHEYFNPTHQRDINQLNQGFTEDLNKGLPLEAVKEKYRPLRNRIEQQQQLGLSAANTYKTKMEALNKNHNVDFQRAVPFLNDSLFPPKDQNGITNFDTINENQANQVELHPSTYDAHGAVLGSANKIKTQIEQGELDPETFRGNNGAYFQRHLDKFRFRVDPKTGRIADDVLNMYANDPKVYDRILWDDLAKKNNVLDDNVILPEERSKIDQLFMQEKNNPKNAPVVKEQIEQWLNGIQGEVHRTDAVSAGRDLNPNAGGYKAVKTTPALSEAETVALAKNYDEVPSAGQNKNVIAVKGRGMDLQNYLKNTDEKLTLGGKTGALIGLGIDPKTGEKSILLREDKQFGGYHTVNVPFNDYNEKAITKYLDKAGTEAVNQWKKEPIQKLVRDDAKIDQSVDKVKSIVENNTDDTKSAEELKKYLTTDLGIDVKNVEVDHSNIPFTNKKNPLSSHSVKIDGDSFELNEKGILALKKHLFNKNMSAFGKESNAQDVNPDDFNSKWEKLKSGESLVGPDGKTYQKK